MISWRDRLMRCCDTMLIMLRLPSQRLIRSIAVTIRGPGAWMSSTFSSPPPSISKESKSPPATSHAKTLLPPCYYANATALLQPSYSPGPTDCNYPGTGTTGHRCTVACSNFDIDISSMYILFREGASPCRKCQQ